MFTRSTAVLAGLLALPASAGDAGAGRPSLDLRATPRVALVPGHVLLTADLRGGEDGEALHCLTAVWEWGDDTESEEEGDCEPWEPGRKVQRRFTFDREFRAGGRPTVTLRLMKGDKVVARASVPLVLKPREKNDLLIRSGNLPPQGTAPGGTP